MLESATSIAEEDQVFDNYHRNIRAERSLVKNQNEPLPLISTATTAT